MGTAIGLALDIDESIHEISYLGCRLRRANSSLRDRVHT